MRRRRRVERRHPRGGADPRSVGKEYDVTRIRGAVVGAALLGVAAIGGSVLPSAAQEEPQPIVSEPLTGRAVFTDDVDLKLKVKLHGGKHHGAKRVVVKAKDPSRTFVGRFTVQPGAQFPWHT